MDFPTPVKQKKLSDRCMSREAVVRLRKILITGASIYFLLYKLEDFFCPNYISEIESYGPVSRVIEDKYVETLEKYLMNNSEYYHLTQVFTYDKQDLENRFHHLLRFHYTYFVDLEDTVNWDAELIAETKNNFTRPALAFGISSSNSTNGSIEIDKFRIDKILLYKIQEVIAKAHGYHSSFFMEIGMNDLFRNYSTQVLVNWYHWRGMILETDLVSLHNYVKQPVHTTIMCPTAICTDDKRIFHYLAINKNAIRSRFRDHFRVIYRVPCFHLSSYAYLFRSDHIEYFIVGPRCDLMPTLRTIVKQKNVHFILVILEKNVPGKAVRQLLTQNSFTLFYNSRNESEHYAYLLFYKSITRPDREIN